MRLKLLILFTAIALMMCGCMPARTPDAEPTAEVENTANAPSIPDKLELSSDGVPMLSVYDTEKKKLETMDMETYVMGVLAGEMKNDWALEALKAQAVLARTFVLKFIETKRSKYEGADISTDVSEAQAYNSEKINENIRKAVEQTRGMVLSYDGELVYAWFHAHSGGQTEIPSVALEYKEDPEYLKSVPSEESENAPDTVKSWKAAFSVKEVEKACADAGVETGAVKSVDIGETGDSGRTKTLLVNGVHVSAPSFRLQIGASELKSTLIDTIVLKDGAVTFTGRGYGHGVGMSQWGAYKIAEDGGAFDDIIEKYFTGTEIVKLWE